MVKMISNNHSYVAEFGGKHGIHTEPIIGWSPEGYPLVAGDDGLLVDATSLSNFLGLENQSMDPDHRIVQVIPANGWMVEFTDGEGNTWTEPLVGWGVTESGFVRALYHDGGGNAEPLNGVSTEHQIYHQDE